MSVWRLIVDGPCDGAWNMAVDAAMLDARARGEAPPTLRLYRWARPTVSLGRFQDASDVDAGAARDLGVDVVRRPTGGRGVLHDDELTYSIVAGVEDGLPRGVLRSYTVLATVLADAYRRLGVPAQVTARPRGSRFSGACYLHATQADLSLGAAKLSGSAQVWLGDAFLQHGSFVRSRDCEAEARLFGLGEEGATLLRSESTTLLDALGFAPPFEQVLQAVIAALEEGMGVTLEPGALSHAERAMANDQAAGFAVPMPRTSR
ncbi:MAG: lipoate--protein ligase family protein [Coriobacteriia bacterium]|nr:lipoate--protein ligase family protein [Coriobacteriia bacterium]